MGKDIKELFNVVKMSDKKLKDFISSFDMDSKMGAAAAMQLKAAKKEAAKRRLKLEGTSLPRPRATPKPRPSSYKVDKSPDAVKKRVAMFRGINKAREKEQEEGFNSEKMLKSFIEFEK